MYDKYTSKSWAHDDDDDDEEEEEEEEEEEITFMFVNIHNDWRIFFLLTV